MRPKVSIIIPCYNCEDTLQEAVVSCYSQDLSDTDFEIVLVDDCSKDHTREKMTELAAKYPNIRLFFHDENKGGGATRNTAVENSLSDVIFCLDSDDLLPPRTLAKMLSFLTEKQCDGVCFHHSINFRGTDTTDISHIVTMARPGEKIVFTDLFQRDGQMCGLYQVFMITKDAFWKAGGYPNNHGFDTQGFAWRFLASGLTAYTCPEATYLLRVQFKESYYLREYNDGKKNFNWQKIFLEHIDLFDPETQTFIKNFDCQDFTRDIFAELLTQKKVLRDDYTDYLGNLPTYDTVTEHGRKPIKRNSLIGWYLRIKNRIR
jgi:glycosyltransferase involved in cell wall biosynthesis